jgi:hypothetical protein
MSPIAKIVIIIIIVIVIIAAILYFLLYFNKSLPAGVSDMPAEEIFDSDQTDMPSSDDQYFSTLEDNSFSGGPGKDGIPSIDSPKYTSIAEGDDWLLPDDIVFGVDYKGLLAAYPQRILVWHEIVNETIDDEYIIISYCPLTGTSIGYKGYLTADIQSRFGVSGKLVNSNLIMYDRATDSYWPQIIGTAIKGEAKGYRLSEFPIIWTTWEKWKNSYPSSKVLSKETGFIRNYDLGGDPYGSYISGSGGYYFSDQIIFPVVNEDGRLSPKIVVIGIRDLERNAVAVLKDYLKENKNIEIDLAGKVVILNYDEKIDFYTAQIKESGEWINAFDAMWFSWAGYYPETELIK